LKGNIKDQKALEKVNVESLDELEHSDGKGQGRSKRKDQKNLSQSQGRSKKGVGVFLIPGS
jgi:hypothetical protein